MQLSFSKLIKSKKTKHQSIKPLTTPIIKNAISIALIAMASSLVTMPSFAKNPHKNWHDGRLIIELAPALCASSLSYGKYSQCQESRPYVIGGLDLQKHSTCYSHTVPTLPTLQAKVVNRLIPDRKQQIAIWRQYGACSNINATNYFRQIIQQSHELYLPKVITMGSTTTINTTNLIQQLKNNNKLLSSDSIQLSCQRKKNNLPILSKVAICYQNGYYAQCPSKVANTCGHRFMILGR